MHARSQFFAIELNFPHLNFSNVLRVLALHVLENICFVVAIGHGTGVLHRSINHSTASVRNDGAGRLDCDSRRALGPVTTIRGVYMTQLNRLQRLAALSARNERSF